MERRDFLKLCSMTGLSVAVGSALSGSEAQADTYSGTLFITCSQGGGWDVTSICDPKGCETEAEQNAGPGTPQMNRYLRKNIRSNSKTGVQWAPLSESPLVQNNQQALDGATAMETFFETWSGKMLVINGVDHQTNAHDVGARLSVTGNAAENSASFGAVASAALLPNAPMGYVGFGGYTGTGGLTAVTRLGNIDVIKRLAYPYRRDPDSEDQLYFNDEQAALIAKAREDRFNTRFAAQRLPKLKTAMNTLYLSRLGQNELKKLVDFLPGPDQLLNGLAGAVQLTAAAYKAGLCVSMSMGTGGWDNHGDVDVNVAQAVGNLFDPNEGIPMCLKLLQDAGILDKTLLMMASDFGRTPGYNDGNGKDHFAFTSYIVMGGVNGKAIKPGVKGGTNERQAALDVDPTTGVLKEGTGLTIKAPHIHNNLRSLAGIAESEPARRQPTTADVGELTNLIEVA